jgi:hypothetical protein
MREKPFYPKEEEKRNARGIKRFNDLLSGKCFA